MVNISWIFFAVEELRHVIILRITNRVALVANVTGTVGLELKSCFKIVSSSWTHLFYAFFLQSPGSNESRVVVISKLLLHKHPLWAMSQFASSSVKTARLTHHSQLSTNQDLGCPRISPAGMKVIQEFRLHDVLRKQEERVKTKGGRYKIQKQHLRKVSICLAENMYT